MTSRSGASGSSVLLIIIAIFTFPIWFAIGAAFFGIIAGLFGAAIGIVGAIFGILVAAISLPFKLIFGWGDWGFGFHWSPLTWFVLLIIAIIIVRRPNR
jgi:hypothetical protein